MKKLFLLFVIIGLSLICSCINSNTQTNVYKNNEHSVSFRYTNNWKQAKPQLEGTLCLLYEYNIHASCVVSFIKAERNTVLKYDTNYMSFIANSAWEDVTNLNVRFEKSGGKEFSICTFDSKLPNMVDGYSYPMKNIIYTTNSNGNRYMMIFTVQAENYDLLKNDVAIMAGTFSLL